MYEVEVWLNRREDASFYLNGYTRGDALERVVDFTVDADDHREAADVVFELGNLRERPDAKGVMYPHNQRSISVGDVLIVWEDTRSKVFACANVGWTEIRLPIEVLKADWEAQEAATR